MAKLSFPTRKLGDFISRITDRVMDLPENQRNLPIYGVTNQDGITITGIRASDDISKYVVVKENQFAYNPYRINVGSLGFLPEGMPQGAVSPAYIVFEASSEIVPEFLYRYLKSNTGLGLIKWYGDRGGVRAALRYNDLCDIEIPDLSYEQQISALEFIEKANGYVNKIIDQLSCQENNSRLIRHAILRSVINGDLNVNKASDEELCDMLERIKEERLSYAESHDKKRIEKMFEESVSVDAKGRLLLKAELVCSHITKGTTPKLFVDNPLNAIPFLKVYNIVDNEIDFNYRQQYVTRETHETSLSRSKVYPNDVLMNIVGPPLAKVAVVPNQFPEWNINQAIAFFRPISFLNPAYLHIILKEGSLISDIATVGTAGQDNISLAQCRNLCIPIPPLDEQERIIAEVNRLMDLCDQLEQSIEISKRYTSMLMESILSRSFMGGPKKIIPFPQSKSDTIVEDWDIAAHAEGDIKSETQGKIAARLAALSKTKQ